MKLSRARAIALLASTPFLSSCGAKTSVRVGSKNFTESIVIAEIYAQALERAGFRVERRFNLGSTQIALAAIRRGDIDLYPEYTGTALIDVLHHAPVSSVQKTFEIVSEQFKDRFGLTWLTPSPMDDSQGIATTAAIAERYGLRTLSDLSRLAPRLRLATIQEFLARPDGLPGLEKRYGGFHFESVRTYDIALKYQALLTGRADVATAFTTDGAIATNHLVVLQDDKHFWPPYNVAPVVRDSTASNRKLVDALDAIAPSITSSAASRMNAEVEAQQQDPADVAAAFLKASAR
jgi:osmoprotectant transport system substrate-binding protein